MSEYFCFFPLSSITCFPGEQGLFMAEVIQGSVADKAGVNINDRLLEINGENVESCTHDQVVDKIKLAGSSIMFLLVDKETDRHYQNKRMKIGAWLATTKHLLHMPRIANMTKGFDGYGFLLKEETNQGKAIINSLKSTEWFGFSLLNSLLGPKVFFLLICFPLWIVSLQCRWSLSCSP